ncbi:MAG TPA: hypothetical protein DCM73_14110 [Clostridiales bacterium]|nr:hypothetical protein [Clostridiales bacterium]
MSPDINYIIRQALKGDKKSQEILLQKLKPLIYKNIYAHWYVSEDITEDLAQEGYAVILESLKTYDKEKDVHFLYYVQTRLVYFYKNYYRNSQKSDQEVSTSTPIGQEDFRLEDILKSSSDTLDTVISHEETRELLANIKKLSKKEQEILYLYYYEQLNMYEISQNLNIPYNTVRGIKYTAIKKLRNKYRR